MHHSASTNRKLRLLQITEAYPPDYGGGVAVYVQDISRYLSEIGHEVRVLAVDNIDKKPYSVRTEYNGSIRVDRINLPYIAGVDPEGWKLGLLRWIRHQRRLVRVVRDLLADWAPNLVHGHGMRLWGDECTIHFHQQGIPVIWMLHDFWPICIRRSLLSSPTNVFCNGPKPIKCVECIYSNYDGTHLRSWLRFPWRILKLGPLPAYRVWRRQVASQCSSGANGPSNFVTKAHQSHLPGLVKHIPLGVDLRNLPEQRLKNPRNPLRFGFIGGFAPDKGVWHVLDAIASLRRRGYDCELHLWGLGTDENAHVWGHKPERSRRDIAARGIESRVFMHGMYKPDEIGQVFSSVDVAIMASTTRESFGRVPKEAGAVGVPTIAPDIGGISEQIRHGIDGLLYKFCDPMDLEQQMEKVLRDPALVNRLASNLCRPPDTQKAVRLLENFYYQVVEASAQSSSITSSLHALSS